MKRIFTIILICWLSQGISAKEIDEKSLLPEALSVYRAYLALESDAENAEKKAEFMNVFPSKFSQFLKVFHPKDFSQLYHDSHHFVFKFNEISLKEPEKYVNKILSLASEACFDADAPNAFRMGLKNFIDKQKEIYEREFKKLPQAMKDNINLFLSASFHPHDQMDGFCDF